jgi:shikimate dehydrogenase
MERFALLGWPVKHSLSPPMQEAGFRAVGIDAVYELIEVHPDDLPARVTALKKTGYRGWNVTVPHKEQMAELIDTVDPEARAAASVNTVVNRGKLDGYSTDGYGLAAAIREAFGLDLTGRHIMFLGAGGAARAVAVYFALHGARAVSVANRTLEKARMLVDLVAAAVPCCETAALPLCRSDALCDRLPKADIIIQSTSLGLHRGDPMPLDPELLPAGVPVMDMIYGDTPFLRKAAERGCPTADGRGMLLHQGARSFEIWTGITPPVEAMRQALDAALAQRKP